jgi:beta-lactamase regulating signal transducer with metallopeptidase domain
MTAVFEWALANAAMAVVLAVPAYLSRWWKRPAVTHALWLLVLLRLVAPPLWTIPISLDSPTATDSTASLTSSSLTFEPLSEITDSQVSSFFPEPATDVVDSPPLAAPAVTPVNWRQVVGAMWAVGVLGCLTLAVSRIIRFHRLLRFTTPAPVQWVHDSESIAHSMGLPRLPEMRLVRGTIAPLVWAGFGRTVLLLPELFVARIDAERRAALIAHELAHLRRGDHLVRWLELAVTALYWWLPLVWLARRELRDAEEQLCDSWVVWVLPDARRAYAAALVDTVDYLSDARPLLPPLASGMGEVRQLKRRIVMIMNGRTPRRLARWTSALGLGVAAALLSVAPTFADDDPPAPPTPPSPPAAPRPPLPPEVPDGPVARRLDPQRAEEADNIRQEMRKLREAMNRLENRLAEIEGRPAPRGAFGGGMARTRPPGLPPTPGAPAAPVPPSPPRAPGGFGGMGGFGPGGGGGFGPPGMGGANVERRIEEMSRAIEKLSQELAEMRRMIRERGTGGRPGRGDGDPQPTPRPFERTTPVGGGTAR